MTYRSYHVLKSRLVDVLQLTYHVSHFFVVYFVLALFAADAMCRILCYYFRFCKYENR